MDQKKYIGLDVHQASISVAVRDAAGKLVTESIIETKATTILEFVRGIRGSLWITFEEGTNAAWLYDYSPNISSRLRRSLVNAAVGLRPRLPKRRSVPAPLPPSWIRFHSGQVLSTKHCVQGCCTAF